MLVLKIQKGTYTVKISKKTFYNDAENAYNAEQTLKIKIEKEIEYEENVLSVMIDMPTQIVILTE